MKQGGERGRWGDNKINNKSDGYEKEDGNIMKRT
jgi:hypothetical protein